MLWEHELQAQKENKLVKFDHQNVNSLCSHHDYVNSSRQFCVSIELRNMVLNQSVHIFALGHFLNNNI